MVLGELFYFVVVVLLFLEESILGEKKGVESRF